MIHLLADRLLLVVLPAGWLPVVLMLLEPEGLAVWMMMVLVLAVGSLMEEGWLLKDISISKKCPNWPNLAASKYGIVEGLSFHSNIFKLKLN